MNNIINNKINVNGVIMVPIHVKKYIETRARKNFINNNINRIGLMISL